MSAFNRRESRIKRQKRVRRKIRGTTEKPRLCVYRSSRNIYAQIIDDTTGKTLVEASSLSRELKPEMAGSGGNKKGGAKVGAAVAARALEKGIKTVVFDRNGFLYHGRVKELSEAARAQGLEF
jgi:large subunit ribosomal protein L18